MKILNAQQIRELDAFTIENEPVSSFFLMERASQALSYGLSVISMSANLFLFFAEKEITVAMDLLFPEF